MSRSKSHIWFILLARWISIFGDTLHQIALPLVIYKMTGSVTDLSLAFIAETLPWIFIAPIASKKLITISEKRILIISDLIRATLCIIISIISYNRVIFFIIMFLFGSCTSIFSAYRSQLLATLISKTDLPKILGIQTTVSKIVSAIAQPFGACLLAVGLNVFQLFLLDGMTYLVSALLFLLSKGKNQNSQVDDHQTNRYLDIAAIKNFKPSLKKLLGAESTRSIGEGIFQPVFVVLLMKIYTLSETSYAWANSVVTLMQIVSGVYFAIFFIDKRDKSIFAIATILLSFALIGLSLIPAFLPYIFAISACLGVGMGLRQLHAENQVMAETHGSQQAYFISVCNAVLSLSYIFGYVISLTFADQANVKQLFIISGVFVLIGLFRNFSFTKNVSMKYV